MSKFFRKLCCCGATASSPDVVNSSSVTVTRESRVNRNSNIMNRQQSKLTTSLLSNFI